MDRVPPEGSGAFEELMLAIDKRLACGGYTIPQRSINALGELSRQFKIALPMGEPNPDFHHESDANWPISERVYKWYEERYGERTKIDFARNRMVILIEEELWVLKFPTIYGTAKFTISPTTQSDGIRTDGQSAAYNVFDALQDFPKARRANVPEIEMRHIFEKFLLGMESFSLLEGSAENSLIKSAIADVSSAVNHLMSPSSEYGLSKWSSLQAAEKVIKAAITLNGSTFSPTHNLSKLLKQTNAAGISCDHSELAACIQCSPGIRYGDEACSRDEALLAHNAMLGLVVVLSKSGAKFTSNIGGLIPRE